MYTIEYLTKYDSFCFTPFVRDLTTAKVLYLKHLWWGCKSVRIVDSFNHTVWKTPEKVIDLTTELPF